MANINLINSDMKERINQLAEKICEVYIRLEKDEIALTVDRLYLVMGGERPSCAFASEDVGKFLLFCSGGTVTKEMVQKAYEQIADFKECFQTHNRDINNIIRECKKILAEEWTEVKM